MRRALMMGSRATETPEHSEAIGVHTGSLAGEHLRAVTNRHFAAAAANQCAMPGLRMRGDGAISPSAVAVGMSRPLRMTPKRACMHPRSKCPPDQATCAGI